MNEKGLTTSTLKQEGRDENANQDDNRNTGCNCDSWESRTCD